MNDLNVGNFMIAVWFLLTLQAVIFLAYLLAKKKLTGDRFKRFLGIMLIGMACTMIPFGFLSMIFGAPAALLTAVLVTIFLDKEKP